MQKLLPLLCVVGLLTASLGCHHTTKKYYEEDRVIVHDNDHRDHHDYDRHNDRRDHH